MEEGGLKQRQLTGCNHERSQRSRRRRNKPERRNNQRVKDSKFK